MIEQLAAGAVGERCIHLVEEVLRLDEEAAVAVLQGLEQQPTGQAGFPDTGRANEDNVLGTRDEVEFGEGTDLSLVDAGLFLEGKGLQRPRFGHRRLPDAPGERALLPALPLGAQEPRQELGDGELLGLGLLELRVEDRGDLLQVQGLEQLFQVVIHRRPPGPFARAAG